MFVKCVLSYVASLTSAETERNLARNSLGSLENLGAQTRSLARTSARSQLLAWRSSLGMLETRSARSEILGALRSVSALI